MSLFFIKTKTPFRLLFCPLFLLLKNRIEVSPSTQCGWQKHESLCLSPFRRSRSWKLLVQPDDTLSIFSRKSGGKDLSSSIFFFFFTVSIFGISQSPKRHIGPDSIWVEGGFLHCTGLFIHWKLRSKKFHGRPLQSKDFMCSTLPPPPNMRAAGIVGALMAFKCCSKKGKQAWKV